MWPRTHIHAGWAPEIQCDKGRNKFTLLLCSDLRLHLKHCLLSQWQICIYNSFLNTFHHGGYWKTQELSNQAWIPKKQRAFFGQTLLSSTMLFLTPAGCRKRLLCSLTWASFVVWPPPPIFHKHDQNLYDVDYCCQSWYYLTMLRRWEITLILEHLTDKSNTTPLFYYNPTFVQEKRNFYELL